MRIDYWASIEIIALILEEYTGCCDLLGAIWSYILLKNFL